MDKNNGKDTTQLIEAAKERLRWYTLETPGEEYDAEEVEALVNLLNTLEPAEDTEMQNDEADLARFHEYVKMRDTEEGIASKFSSTQKKYSGLTVFVKAHKIIATAAAIFIVIIVAGGSLGAVNASKGNGFFYWLNRDERGMTMITSPENMDGEKNILSTVEYSNVEEVPEEYRDYLVAVNEIEQLKEYNLKYIRILHTKNYERIKCCYEGNEDEREISVGVFVYENGISLTSETYLTEKNENSMFSIEEGDVLIRENQNGEIEYMIFFFRDNIQYYVEGNAHKNDLIDIAKEYRDIIME